MDQTTAHDIILAMVREYAYLMAYVERDIPKFREEAWAALAEFGLDRETVENSG